MPRAGIEPATFCLRDRRSPAEPTRLRDERGRTSSISSQRKQPVIMELSSSLSLESPPGSFRRAMQSRRPIILITNTDNNSTEVEDDFSGEFYEPPFSSASAAVRKQPTTAPQMSKLFSTELCNLSTSVSDESSNTLPTSSISSNQSVDSAPELEENEIRKSRGLSLTGTCSGSHENWKEKFVEKKKKSSLQHFRLYNLQCERPLSRHRSTEAIHSLTPAQIHLIRNIWRQVYVTKGPTVIGSTLLHGIFFKARKIKDQFFHCPFPHRFPNRDSFNKAHAKAVGEMLDKIVDNLENLELMSGYLFSIGTTHANLVQRQSSNEMWNLMAETFIDCTLDWGDKKGRTEASRKAWAFIIAFVIEKIKGGHLFERRQLAAYRRRSSTIAASQTTVGLLPSSAPTIRFWKSIDETGPSNIRLF
ncbi:unnamed protein product [Litomosoides sigmodontis]|uniref:Globin domain-containing protein n=1 Tax=Litomosoides sigmodontis TaxID=42156 RepID=A0A3P6VGH3_LITSI|nr:unnamed protein product [Litomosoides sigmodontis]